MNTKQRATLAKIFATPTPKDIPWTDIESLMRALDAQVLQREGSRVRFGLGGVVAVLHEPHPERHTPMTSVRQVRIFLERAGVHP